MHGVELGIDGHRSTLRLSEVRRGRVRHTVQRANPLISGNVVTYHHRSAFLDEWFVNGPLGVEHGFDLHRRGDGGSLELVLAVEGSLRVAARDGAIVLQRPDGTPVLRYGQPSAWDAGSRPLPAAVTVRDGRIVLRVDDAKAVYPIHVDPLIWREQARVVDSGASPDAFVGYGLDVDGDRLVVGTSFGSEAVSVHRRIGTTWPLEERITSPAGGGDGFGDRVALAGHTLAVSARHADTSAGVDAGAVYVFVLDAGRWMLQAMLEPSAAGREHFFGADVALQGETLVVSSCDAARDVVDAGSIYVFERAGTVWTETARLTASGGSGRDCWLGGAVALDGSWLATGIYTQRDDTGNVPGAAFVFERTTSGWVERARLDPSTPYAEGRFGWDVTLRGDVLVVGAPDITPGATPGEAYVYRRDGATWREEAMLVPTPGGSHDHFGSAVAIVGEHIAVGAPGADYGGLFDVGRVFVFAGGAGSWPLESVLTPSTPTAGVFLGRSAAGRDRTLALAAGSMPGWVDVYALRREVGDACATPDDCHSGFCADGVCCDLECGAGALDDCIACSVAAGAAADGTCGPVNATAAHVCRPVAGACDIEEVCDGSTSCPADAHFDASVVCREPVGPCDAEERCSGAAAGCPADVFLDGEFVCRASVAVCDAEERCDGASAGCPPDALAGAETVCRAAAMPCDSIEVCDGSSLECRPDALMPDGASCSDELACNGGETCADGMCIAGAALDCDDFDACTADSCAEPEGCVHERFCCRRDIDCDDFDACTVDSCDPSAERCVHVLSLACDAGSRLDAGLADGGGPDFATWNCGCHAVGSGGNTRAALLLGLVALVVRARQRRGREPSRRRAKG